MRKERDSDKINYIRKLYAEETPILHEISNFIIKNDKQIHIGPEEGRLLQLIIRMANVKKIVEIGGFYGYSALWMAGVLGEDGHIFSIERNSKRITKAREYISNSGLVDKITMLEGEASDILQSIEEKGPFDMVFIDADKKSYSYYLNWAYHNLNPGGVVVADNTFLFGSVYSASEAKNVKPDLTEAILKFNEEISDKNKFLTVMIATEEGLTIGLKV